MISVRFSNSFIDMCKDAAIENGRSIPKQIKHWSEIGKAIEIDKDMTYNKLKSDYYSENYSNVSYIKGKD